MNWKSYICASLLMGALAFDTQAQQAPQYSLYMFNLYGYNTAYAGLDGSVSATGVFRKQWTSFAGSPLTFQANVHLPIEYLKSGVGLSAEHDRLGAETYTNLRVSYNYIAPLNKKTVLSIGGAVRMSQRTLDGSLLRTPEGNYEGGTIVHNDDLIPLTKATGMTWGAEAGIYLKHENYGLGVSAINLHQPTVSLVALSGETVQMLLRRTYFLTGQYTWNINEDFALQPSVLVKTNLDQWQPELATILKYKKQFWGGVGYRGYSSLTRDAVIVMAGMQFDKHWTLAYSYDISMGALRTYNSGSHELMLNYNLREPLGKAVPQKIIYNPRFL